MFFSFFWDRELGAGKHRDREREGVKETDRQRQRLRQDRQADRVCSAGGKVARKNPRGTQG